VSQVPARTRGGPLPYDPTASLTPSGAVQKRMSGSGGMGDGETLRSFVAPRSRGRLDEEDRFDPLDGRALATNGV